MANDGTVNNVVQTDPDKQWGSVEMTWTEEPFPGQYAKVSITVKAGLSVVVPEGATTAEIVTLVTTAREETTAKLLLEVKAATLAGVREFRKMRAELSDDLNVKAATDRERAGQPAAFPKPVNAPVLPASQPAPAAQPVSGGRQLARAPKAADRQPGDTWIEKCDYVVYKPDGDKSEIAFHRLDAQYADGTISAKSPLWPDMSVVWPLEAGSNYYADGDQGKVTYVVGDKMNTKGFYYVNVKAVSHWPEGGSVEGGSNDIPF